MDIILFHLKGCELSPPAVVTRWLFTDQPVIQAQHGQLARKDSWIFSAQTRGYLQLMTFPNGLNHEHADFDDKMMISVENDD